MTVFAPSNSPRYRAKPRHGKQQRSGGADQRISALGDHAAAVLCALSGLSFPGRGIVVLCGNPAAEEAHRPGSATDLRPAQLIGVPIVMAGFHDETEAIAPM